MDELNWHRVKNAVRRLIKSRIRLAVYQSLVGNNHQKAAMAAYEESSVKESEEALRELRASFDTTNFDSALPDILCRALAEAAEHCSDHFDELGIDARQQIKSFQKNFRPDSLLCPS